MNDVVLSRGRPLGLRETIDLRRDGRRPYVLAQVTNTLLRNPVILVPIIDKIWKKYTEFVDYFDILKSGGSENSIVLGIWASFLELGSRRVLIEFLGRYLFLSIPTYVQKYWFDTQGQHPYVLAQVTNTLFRSPVILVPCYYQKVNKLISLCLW